MASIGSEDGDIGFQIAPMVDVVFVLMLFFMASAGSQVVESELSINLPGGTGSRGGAVKPITPIVIDISPDGQVSANTATYGTPTDKTLSSLREWMKGSVERFGGDNPVIIRPSPDTRHERIMDVLNAVGASGVTKLTFG